MSLMTLQLQGSYSTVSLGPSPWSKGNKLKPFLTIRPAGHRNTFTAFKSKSFLRVGVPCVLGPKTKLFKISAFKGGSRDDAGSRLNGSKPTKNAVKISYVGHESEESSVKSNIPVPRTSTTDEKTSQSVAIQNLLKNWLTLLRAPSENQQVNEVVEEHSSAEPSSVETTETQNSLQEKERVGMVKAIWCSFQGLNVTIKLSLLILVPFYVAVSLAYGFEASRDLTPLWVLGPLIIALYVKMAQFVGGFYKFTVMQMRKLVKSIGICFLVIWDYIFRGKLKEFLRAHIWQRLVDIKNMDYKAFMRQKMKDLKIWMVESYKDYVESIWPFYFRMIIILKKANLI